MISHCSKFFQRTIQKIPKHIRHQSCTPNFLILRLQHYYEFMRVVSVKVMISLQGHCLSAVGAESHFLTFSALFRTFPHFRPFSALIRTFSGFPHLLAQLTSFRTILQYLGYKNQLKSWKVLVP